MKKKKFLRAKKWYFFRKLFQEVSFFDFSDHYSSFLERIYIFWFGKSRFFRHFFSKPKPIISVPRARARARPRYSILLYKGRKVNTPPPPPAGAHLEALPVRARDEFTSRIFLLINYVDFFCARFSVRNFPVYGSPWTAECRTSTLSRPIDKKIAWISFGVLLEFQKNPKRGSKKFHVNFLIFLYCFNINLKTNFFLNLYQNNIRKLKN